MINWGYGSPYEIRVAVPRKYEKRDECKTLGHFCTQATGPRHYRKERKVKDLELRFMFNTNESEWEEVKRRKSKGGSYPTSYFGVLSSCGLNNMVELKNLKEAVTSRCCRLSAPPSVVVASPTKEKVVSPSSAAGAEPVFVVEHPAVALADTSHGLCGRGYGMHSMMFYIFQRVFKDPFTWSKKKLLERIEILKAANDLSYKPKKSCLKPSNK